MRNAELLRYLVLAAQREGNRQLSAAFASIDLTPSQAEVIRVLAEFEPLSLRDLGSMLVCESGSNPSRLVDRLVVAGLVEREVAAEDRRRVTLSLTETGKRASVAVSAVEDQFYRRIDELTAGVDLKPQLSFLSALSLGTSSGDALEERMRRGEGAV